jgi:histidinol-phosphatase
VPSAELQAALDAANAAAAVIRSLYQRNLEVVTKADKSPVTEADVKSEQAIHEVLSKRFPGYGFYGEETGQHDMGAESIWLVDPIDGTKSFVRDCPFFSTQIALLRSGRFVLGVSCAPVYGELAWAERGQGAWLDGKPIKVSSTAQLSSTILSTGNLKTLAQGPRWARFGALVPQLSRLRGYGDFVHYHLLALWRARRGRRVGRQHPRHRRVDRDRRGSGRSLHRPRRRPGRARHDHGAAANSSSTASA